MSLFDRLKKEPTTPAKRPKQLDESRDCFGQPKVRLPTGFAQRVLELEILMENSTLCQLQDMRQLNELYRIAVEYYAQFDQEKTRHFQRKLAQLLSNPVSLRLMDDRVKVEKPSMKKTDLSKSVRLEVGRFNLQAETVVSGMVEGGKAKQARTERMIIENLNRQQISLKERIEQRQKSRQRSLYHREA